jgi:16S rRNA (cytosine1402-N4)-methyltransferase
MEQTNLQGRPPHVPVLYHEIILALQPASPGKFIDGTVGAGGHARGILESSSPDGVLLGLDVDPNALQIASQNLSAFQGRFNLVQASYTTIPQQMRTLKWESVQGILIDLGVSSMQLDTPERGFSFQAEGPLDMRLNPHQDLTAQELVNHLPEDDLADILWKYGEERQSRRIARAICQARPLYTTSQLAGVVLHAVGRQQKHLHPATRVFQALRIAVNQELQSVETVLPLAVAALAPQGRLAVISFHSLEDRIVKQYFALESRDCICPPPQPICTCGHKASIRLVPRKAIEASATEISQNPRARSARLRIAEKL